ncbi:MAG: DUF4082 domain-containing protein [Gemmataceae bacterium]|nr:DUF4082 domain-containing protein [Gemmataceae bacterium]
MSKIRALFAAAAVVVATAAPAPAAFQAIDFAAPTVDFTNGQWSLGFAFQANVNVDVTALGFYDDGMNGLTESHDVGIYDGMGVLLASTTVTNADGLTGWFRYHAIPTLSLTAGETYYIAATTGLENYTWDPIGPMVDPSITFLEDRFVLSSTLAFPVDGPSEVFGWFGPNMMLDTAAVPAPAGLVLLGAAAPVLGLRRALRRKVA